jgi:hypothetical protein
MLHSGAGLPAFEGRRTIVLKMTFDRQAFVRQLDTDLSDAAFPREFLTLESDRVSGLTQTSKSFVTACQSCAVKALREVADTQRKHFLLATHKERKDEFRGTADQAVTSSSKRIKMLQTKTEFVGQSGE